MAHITADRVRQTSTSTGTGTIVLSGSLSGFRTFASVLAVSDTFWYAIASFPGSEWEVGLGTYSALNTITRTTVLASSNAGAAVVFSAGDKEVFITAAASKFLQQDSTGSYGNFTAGTITAALTGNASTVTTVTASNFSSQTANTVLAAPDGAAGVPTFRNLLLTDLPDAWVKRSCGCATTAALTINTAQTTIDGVTLAATTRVLVKNQAASAENGIYTGVTTTTWVRAADADTAAEIAGAFVNIDAGTVNGGKVFDCDFKSTDTLGTSPMSWSQNVDVGYFTTVGNNFATLTNPSAITFPRINADNTVSTLDAATFRTAIGAGTSSTTGTVTSVGGTGTVSGLTLTGTVTTTGNLTLGGTLAVTASNFASQTANTFLSAPNGAAGVPTFRAIVAADVPTLNQNTTGSAATLTTSRTLWGQGFTGAANVTGSLTSVGNITGTGAVTLTATAGTLALAATGANIITATTNGSEKLRIDSTGLLSFNSGYGSAAPAYGCRAWVNFDGTASETFAGGTSTASRTAGSTTVTVTTTTAHGLITGNRVYVAFSISGVAQGLYTVTNTGTTTFTITTVATTVLSSVAISFVLNNIRGAGNISSVADVSAGYYVMNFATAMPDSNYAILSTVGSGVNPTSRGNDELPFIGEHNEFYATLYVEGADDQAGDKLYMSAAFFR